jgi:hypothetical protein
MRQRERIEARSIYIHAQKAGEMSGCDSAARGGSAARGLSGDSNAETLAFIAIVLCDGSGSCANDALQMRWPT